MEFRSTYKWGGGPDKTVLNSARFHDKNKFEVTVVYLRSERDQEFALGEKGRAMGVDVVEVYDDDPIRSFKEVLGIIKDKKIDILHSRDYKTNLYALLIKTFFVKNLKIVTTTHGWVGKGLKLSIYYTLDKIITAFFDKIFILYRDQVKDFIFKPPPQKIVIMHNAIDPEEWNPERVKSGKVRKELGLANDAKIIGFVGRIMPEKDLITFVHVARQVVDNLKEKIIFLMIGEGKDKQYEEKVRSEIQKCGLQSNFIFLGPRKDLREIYRDMDVFLLTSVKEGVPNTLLEAMAMKAPAVVSAIDGIPEIIEDRKTGLLCEPAHPEQFATAALKLLSNPSLYDELRSNARRLIEGDLSFKKRLGKMEHEYISLLETSLI